MIEYFLAATLWLQSHPCDTQQPTSYAVSAETVLPISWCQAAADTIDGFTVNWTGTLLDLAIGAQPGAQVAAKVGVPSAKGQQEWRSTLFFGAGVHTLTLTAWNVSSGARQPSAASAAITVTAAATSPQPPARGPQPTITCPVGAVDVAPGSSLQAAVNANPGPTVFCLRAGVHNLTASVTPKSGNTFVGEFGAILDGGTWVTTDPLAAAFRAHNQDINDVTIRNLVLRNMPQRNIHAFSSGSCHAATHTCSLSTAGADRWTVENVETNGGVYGLSLTNYAVARNNYVHHASLSGYAAYLTEGSLWENNEFASNGNESKIIITRGTVFRNNWIHHSANGIWYDGENSNALIEGNLIEDTNGQGIYYEVSGSGVIRNNTIRRTRENAIFVSTSHDVEVYGNVLEENGRGITYFVDCLRVGHTDGGWFGEPFALNDVSSHDNTISFSDRPDVFASGFSWTSCTPAQVAVYTSGQKNLTFTSNAYTVPHVSGGYWLWDGVKTWAQWQGLGQDAGSTVNGGPPPAPVDCVVSEWSAWSAWTPISATTMQRSRQRTVVTQPANGGAGCPSLTETQTLPIPPEVCGDGIDNDLDGVIDDGCQPPLDPCVAIPFVVDRIAWPSANTGRRTLTFRTVEPWVRYQFTWPGQLVVTAQRGCETTVMK